MLLEAAFSHLMRKDVYQWNQSDPGWSDFKAHALNYKSIVPEAFLDSDSAIGVIGNTARSMLPACVLELAKV